MSAPDTNIEKQKRNHRPSLLGINAVLVFAFALLALFIGYLVYQGNEPRDASDAAPVIESTETTGLS